MPTPRQQHWIRWAEQALRRMDAPDWAPKRADEAELENARRSLRAVAESGDEPYYTLRAFVVLNNLEDKNMPA